MFSYPKGTAHFEIEDIVKQMPVSSCCNSCCGCICIGVSPQGEQKPFFFFFCMRPKPCPVEEDIPFIVFHVAAKSDPKAGMPMRMNLFQESIKVGRPIRRNHCRLHICKSILGIVKTIFLGNPP